MVSKVFHARAHPSIFIPCYDESYNNLVVLDDDYETINTEGRDNIETTQRPQGPGTPSTDSSQTPHSRNAPSPRAHAGERLYNQAFEHKKRLELMRRKVAKGGSTNLPAIPSAKPKPILRQTKSEGSNFTAISTTPCIDRLYGLSTEKQEYGRRRREEIARASAERNSMPSKDFGKIPLSKADGMYHKGVRALRTKEAWVAQKQEEKAQIIDAKHEFKLAEGAFAYSFDRDYKFGPPS